MSKKFASWRALLFKGTHHMQTQPMLSPTQRFQRKIIILTFIVHPSTRLTRAATSGHGNTQASQQNSISNTSSGNVLGSH
jgi:hypothetical protein